MLALYIILGILLFLAALLLVPTDFGIEYSVMEGEQRMVLHLRVLFIPIRIPIRIKKDEVKLEREAEEAEKKFFSGLTWDKLRRTVRGVRKAYRKTRTETRDALRCLKKRITVKQIVFDIDFGLSDAAKTGIMTGAIWAGGTTALSVIDNLFGIRRVEMNVRPDFTQEQLKIHWKSIITTQLVYIINIVIKVLLIANTYVNTIEQEIAGNKETQTKKKKEKAVHENGRTSN